MNILRDREAGKKLGYTGAATMWRKAKADPAFPQPVKVGPRCTGWLEHELDEYLSARVAASRKVAA